jgi:hypothetical protein
MTAAIRRRLPFGLGCLMLGGWAVFGPLGLLYTSMFAVALQALNGRLELMDVPALRRRSKTTGEADGLLRSVKAMDSELAIARHSMREFDRTLRPRLERVLATRLRDSHGIRLERRPDRAHELVGDQIWTLLDPARPNETSRSMPGPTRADLARVVDRLEAL